MPPRPASPDFDVDAFLQSVGSPMGEDEKPPKTNGHKRSLAETSVPTEPLDPADLLKQILSDEIQVQVVPEPTSPAIEDSNPPDRPQRTTRKSAPNLASKPKIKRPPAHGADDAEQDILRKYLNEIGQYPLLDKEGEILLAQTREAGLAATARLDDPEERLTRSKRRQLEEVARQGQAAEKTFIQSNYRLVVSIAKRYQGRGLPLLDLIQEGNLGMMHAVEMFDWRKGFKFSTYATYWIRQSVGRAIENTGQTIRVPVQAAYNLKLLSRTRNQLQDELGRQPTNAEICEILGWDDDKLRRVIFASQTRDPISFDEPIGRDKDGAELGDLVADPGSQDGYNAAVQQADLITGIDQALGFLGTRERRIIELRYGLATGEPMSLEAVGEESGLTRERIRQIEKLALTKLRHPANTRRMTGFAGYKGSPD